jgi:hypothetical protein
MTERSVRESTIDRDSQSGRDTLTTADTREHASILIDRHYLIPDMAFFVQESEPIEPKKYHDAWHHKEKLQQAKWRGAITKEFADMKKRKVWRKIKRIDMPTDRRCVKSKWVFLIKRDGRFRARLVACGYSQIPGVDYTDNYAPVINDVTYRIMLICEIVWKLTSKIIDVETAFLHGDLEEEIYMDCPDGLAHENDECLLLLQTIYGLVQSARQFFKKLVKCLKTIGFVGGVADPCLMTKNYEKGIVMIGLYVDDCYCIGHKGAIEDTIAQIKASGFNVKVEDTLEDYLSCNIVFNKDKTKAWLGQPHLIKNLDAKFGDLVKGMQRYKTPGTPGIGVTRPSADVRVKVDAKEQELYRSGVGMLLYLVKHSRPDIANVVRELSKVVDGATPAAMKELRRVIKFVLDTRTFGLKIEPKLESKEAKWTMTVYTDSEYAGDKDTRISVGGYIIFLLGVPILWKSKAQRSVTLSSAEAEFVALSEAAKDIKFVAQVLESMGIKVELPIVVRVDNVGAIFMSENVSTTSRTRHVDVRYHYVREYVEDGFVRILFVRSEDNLADEFTKNVSGALYDAHVSIYMGEKKTMERT